MSTDDEIKRLTEQLGDEDAVVRQKSRHDLIDLRGPDVTRAMIAALIDSRTHVRWEAAKILMAIADTVAAPALVNAMDDEDVDVRWIAAEALVALGHVGLLTVLNGLTKRASSVAFCQSAHHVLHETQAYENLLAPVRETLEQPDAAIKAPSAAYKALVSLNNPNNAG